MSRTNGRPALWIVAGPNGAGKTTYAFRHIRAVSETTRFVNLDEIARGLSPLDPSAEPQRAARVALAMIDDLIAARLSFSLETTLAGRTHLRTIERAKSAGFRVNLLYFAVVDVATCLARIARRVSEGGHDVPEIDVLRRFRRSLANVTLYAAECDLWRIYDNNGPMPKTAAEGRGGCVALIGHLAGLPLMLAGTVHTLPTCEEATPAGVPAGAPAGRP
jgi:predicted ABC-type ATPase